VNMIKVRVDGLDEFKAAMSRADFEDRIKDVNYEASRYVAGRAGIRRAALSMRYPSYGHVTLKAERLLSGAAVVVGPVGQAYAAEYGTHVHPVFGRRTPAAAMQRRVWPSHSTDGQMVWPVIKSDDRQIVELYDKALAAELRPGFPD